MGLSSCQAVILETSVFKRTPPPTNTHTPLISYEFLEARWEAMARIVHSWIWLLTGKWEGLGDGSGLGQHILFPGYPKLPQPPLQTLSGIPSHPLFLEHATPQALA